MPPRLSRLPRVVDVAGVAQVERATQVPRSAQRLALLAHWSPGPRQSHSTLALVAELQRLRYWVIISSTTPTPEPLDFGSGPPVRLSELTVLRRPNIGYDFGSWAAAMSYDPLLLDRDFVLVLNDSLVGPFAPLDSVLGDFESTTADVWGMVESHQFAAHLQSFFRGFRYGSLAEPVMRDFWHDVRVIEDKQSLIEQYEFGFTDFLRRHHFSAAAFVDHRAVVREGLNPTIYGWRALLDVGVPFVKRELVRHPELAPDGRLLPRVLTNRYGVTVTDWM